MEQRRQQQHQSQRIFTASEVAEFAYCPLVWWHEQFEPAARADNEELFARLVELEHEHDTQAPALPEYQMIEQLLLRRGAFERGQQQHQEHAAAVAALEEPEELDEMEQERVPVAGTGNMLRSLTWLAAAVIIIGLLLILAAVVLR
jgi:hypothetical protein